MPSLHRFLAWKIRCNVQHVYMYKWEAIDLRRGESILGVTVWVMSRGESNCGFILWVTFWIVKCCHLFGRLRSTFGRRLKGSLLCVGEKRVFGTISVDPPDIARLRALAPDPGQGSYLTHPLSGWCSFAKSPQTHEQLGW